MKTTDFDYALPPELIAQTPLKDRSASKLLVLDRKADKVKHDIFKNIKSYLKSGDCLVLNDTRVLPARLYGNKEKTGGAIEFLLLHKRELDVWEVILRPGRKAQIGSRFEFAGGELTAEVIDIVNDGNRLVRFYYDGVFENILDRLGEMPLPPYITEKLTDGERYQTVYSKNKGSAAAPTAGLHFTNELLDEISGLGVKIVYLTLHVGLGTFRPVKAKILKEHKMHSEFYILNKEAADTINAVKSAGGRIISVGTTSTRVLETLSDQNGMVREATGWTDIFIYPGYNFKCVDALITNFHLPQSTLIMLVSAFAGRERVLGAYNIAVEHNYRFFSFGDAMLII